MSSQRLDRTEHSSPLGRILEARRSVRRYGKTSVTPAQLGELLKVSALCSERLGFEGHAELRFLERGERFSEVVRAAMKGLVGKINPWLPRMDASHFILCLACYQRQEPALLIERRIAEASMLMQVAVLRATELGLGTCWMAGIDHASVEDAIGSSPPWNLVAMSPLGSLPSGSKLLSWDSLGQQLGSKRRKPLDQLVMEESWKA